MTSNYSIGSSTSFVVVAITKNIASTMNSTSTPTSSTMIQISQVKLDKVFHFQSTVTSPHVLMYPCQVMMLTLFSLATHGLLILEFPPI